VPAVTIAPQVRSLNISSEYASYLTVSVREHIQNWRDQCLSLAQRIDTSCTIDDLTTRSNSWHTGEAYALLFQDRTLGWLSWERSLSDGKRSMRIVNHSTALTLDILTLGHSSKRGVDGMAGFFGEGVKVEINRLVVADSRIRYRTANTEWTFFFATPSEAQRVLSVRVEAASSRSRDSTTDTEISLESLPEHVFHAEDFLFLLPPTLAVAASDLSVLLDRRLVSRVHLHGIFVKCFPELNHFGLDFSGRITSSLNLGRDRNHLDISSLLELLPNVFDTAVANNTPVAYIERLSVATYNMLEPLHSSSAVSFSMYMARLRQQEKPASTRAMANCLLQVFFMRHGPNAIPSSEREHSPKHQEAALFGTTLVFVEAELLEWLLLAQDCPTLEYYWNQSTTQVFSLPEYLCPGESIPSLSEYPPCAAVPWETEPLRTRFMQLRESVDRLFIDSGVRGEHVRFKQFDAKLGNTKPIKPLKCGGITFFIVDPVLMAPEALHRELQHEDATFECPSSRGKPCGCIREALFETIISTSARPEMLRKRVMRRMAELMPADATLLDTSAKPTESSNRSTSTATTSKSTTTTTQFGSRSSGSSSSTSTAPTMQPTTQPTIEMYVPQRGAARTVLESIENQALAASTFRSNVGEQTCLVVQCQGEKHESIKVGADPYFGIPVYIDTGSIGTELACGHPLFSVRPTLPESVGRFAIVLRFLARVIQAPLSSINIVWEDSQTMGYNKGGAMFFNLCYFEAMGADDSLVAPLDFWFPVVVHELAHNSNRDHDARFASAVASLTTKYLPQYRALLASLGTSTYALALKHAQMLPWS